MLAVALLFALAASGIGFYWAKQRESQPYRAVWESTAAYIRKAEAEDILSISVTLRHLEPYLLINRSGQLWLDSIQEPLDTFMSAAALSCFTPLYASQTLTDDPDAYRHHLDDFGLADPAALLEVEYSDGERLSIWVGDEAPDTGQRYMLISEDHRLYLCQSQMADAFVFDYRLFLAVDQPRPSSERIDRVTVYDAAGGMCFEYRAADAREISGGAEADDARFNLLHPVCYPVDAEAFKPVLTALDNFVLGPRQAEDTPENRMALGFGVTEYVLSVHETAGFERALSPDGAVTRETRGERTLVIEVGAVTGDISRYVAVGGYIYKINNFQLSFVYGLDPYSTLLRKPFDIPVEDVRAFEHGQDRYTLLRETQQYAPDEGFPVMKVYKNGVPDDGEAFDARFRSLADVTVSGRLPEDFVPDGVTDKYVITAGSETREVTLAEYDSLHDAVGINGIYVFYIIKGGLTF